MKLIFVVLVCFVAGFCNGQQTAKQENMYCLKKESSNLFEMRLTVKLNSDAQGEFWALNNTEYTKNPFVISKVGSCNIAYDVTNKVYTVTSTVDLNTNSNAQDSNLCGRVKNTGAQTTWEWYFLHLSNPPAANSNLEPLIESIDRVYKAVCIMSSLTSDTIQSNVTVSTPNLEKTVTQRQLPVIFKLQKKNLATGVYSDITAPVAAGTTVRLYGEYDRGNDFDANRMVNMIHFYNIIVSPNSDLSNFRQFIDSNGCANVNGQNRPVSVPSQGMKGSISGTTNIHVTTDFFIWKTDNSNNQYFRAYIGVCYFGSTATCVDVCLAKTSVDETLNGRKKRQAEEDGEPQIATLVVQVTDANSSNTSEESSVTNTMVLAGAMIGAAILVMLAIMVCMIAMARRRKMKRRGQKDRNLPVVVPDHNYKY